MAKRSSTALPDEVTVGGGVVPQVLVRTSDSVSIPSRNYLQEINRIAEQKKMGYSPLKMCIVLTTENFIGDMVMQEATFEVRSCSLLS